MDSAAFPIPDISVSLAGVAFEGPPRTRLIAGISWIATLGVRIAHLDATAPGTRPRELDRSAQREIASMLRRESLGFSGVDLWIPREHFVLDAHADRAVSAAMEAIGFAGTVGSLVHSGRAPVVSLALPAGASDVRTLLADASARAGVRIADHAWPPDESAAQHDHLGIGIDPAEIIGSSDTRSPSRALAANASRVVSARLSDTDGTARVPAGEGSLNVFEYVASAITCGLDSPFIVDLRELDHPIEAAPRIIAAVSGG